jgi:hypothetical protein
MRRISRLSAAVALVVAGVTAPMAMAVPPPPDGTFSGETAQANAEQRAVDLSTDSEGQIADFSIDWRAKCKRKGRFWTAGTNIGGGAIELQGEVFGADGSYKSPVEGTKIKGKVTVSLRGTFDDENTASGTWKAKVKVFRRGKRIDTCKVNTSWSAQRVEG